MAARHGQKVCNTLVMGYANAGKSTIVNRLVNRMVSAVSPKRNTTQDTTYGVLTQKNTQVVFHDTPGFLVSIQQQSPHWDTPDIDTVLVIVDSAKRKSVYEVERILKTAKDEPSLKSMDMMLVLNKMDLLRPKSRLRPLAAKMQSRAESIIGREFSGVFFTNARRNIGISRIQNGLMTRAKPAPWAYSAEEQTPWSKLQQSEEVIRQFIYRYCHNELPYLVIQRTLDWEPLPNGSILMRHQLQVDSASRRRILQRTCRFIQQRSQIVLTNILGQPVELELSTRVVK